MMQLNCRSLGKINGDGCEKFHALPAFWRMHHMHHADMVFPVITGARFHPSEISLSMQIGFTVIAVLRPSALAVVVFEAVLNTTSMLIHENVHTLRYVGHVLH